MALNDCYSEVTAYIGLVFPNAYKKVKNMDNKVTSPDDIDYNCHTKL